MVLTFSADSKTTEVRLTWTAEKPGLEECSCSPVFDIWGRAFHFQLTYGFLDSYVLCLYDAEGIVFPKDLCYIFFKISVGIIVERSGTCITCLNKEIFYSYYPRYLCSWKDTLLMEYISNFSETQYLSFEIFFSGDIRDLHFGGMMTGRQMPLYWKEVQQLTWKYSKSLVAQGDSPHNIVELKCKDRFHFVHRSVLSSRSDVFAAMLRGKELGGLVEIKDVNPDIFSELLVYLYSEKISSLTFEKAMELYDLGGKYAIRCLMDLCASFLTEHMVPENTLKCLVMADAHGDQEFKEKVISYILDNKIHLQEEVWLPFCNDHSKVAVEVLNRLMVNCKIPSEFI